MVGVGRRQARVGKLLGFGGEVCAQLQILDPPSYVCRGGGGGA